MTEVKNTIGAGAKQQTVPEDTVVVAICPECKNRIPSTTKFCPECGTDLRPQDK
jgi:predicted amidophosphoribosyltransferase